MKIINGSILLLMSLTLLYSCSKDTDIERLRGAQQLAGSEPAKALMVLDSIAEPDNMDKDSYMHYIVTRTQAKIRNDEDITGDSLVVVAAAYFDAKGDNPNAALANYYTGSYYVENNKLDSALICYNKAEYNARKAKDDLMLAKSLHSIAFIYLQDKNMADSTLTYYQQALTYYDNIVPSNPEINEYKLEVLLQTGYIYAILDDYDKCYRYLQKGLKQANKEENAEYQTKYNLILGEAFMCNRLYEKASTHLHQIFDNPISSQDSIITYLDLSIIYKETNRQDSANYYFDIVKNRIPEIKQTLILTNIYNNLAESYEYVKDYKKALYYRNLEKESNEKAAAEISSQKLVKAAAESQNILKESQLKQEQQRMRMFTGMGILFLVVATGGLIAFFRIKSVRLKYRQQVEHNALLQQQYDKKVESINNLQKVYKNVIIDWIAIDNEVEELAEEYKVTEKPVLYTKIQSLITDIRSNTDKQFIEWVKELLTEDGYKDKEQVKELSHRDLLLIGFCYCKCTKEEMAKLLSLPKQKIHPQKLKIKHLLKNMGLTDERIEALLFYETPKE